MAPVRKRNPRAAARPLASEAANAFRHMERFFGLAPASRRASAQRGSASDDDAGEPTLHEDAARAFTPMNRLLARRTPTFPELTK
jgi:phage terminase small subunit